MEKYKYICIIYQISPKLTPKRETIVMIN